MALKMNMQVVQGGFFVSIDNCLIFTMKMKQGAGGIFLFSFRRGLWPTYVIELGHMLLIFSTCNVSYYINIPHKTH